jgi:hypothetical protein
LQFVTCVTYISAQAAHTAAQSEPNTAHLEIQQMSRFNPGSHLFVTVFSPGIHSRNGQDVMLESVSRDPELWSKAQHELYEGEVLVIDHRGPEAADAFWYEYGAAIAAQAIAARMEG